MAEAQLAAQSFKAVNAVGMGYVKADAYRAEADYHKKIADLNNKTLEYQVGSEEDRATDAASRGEKAALRRDQKTRLQTGSQRAAMAAAGGDPAFGSNADTISETEAIGAADVAAIKTNAWREAFGFRTRANQLRGEQAAGYLASRTKANALDFAARSSIITGWTRAVEGGLEAAAQKGTP